MKAEDENNVSDEEQMVICEEVPQQSDIDLKCKDELQDSENEINEDKNAAERAEKAYNKEEITCRPKPIKGESVKFVNFSFIN